MPDPIGCRRQVHTKGGASRAANPRPTPEGTWAISRNCRVMLWGLDAIKTRGESLGILLELVGQNL